jgi:hypothetical protein
MIVFNLIALAAAANLALSLASDASNSPTVGEKKRWSEFIQIFSSEVGVLAFFDAGLAWVMFTRREKRLEAMEKQKEFFEQFPTAAHGYYKAVETALIADTWDEGIVTAAKTKMAELNAKADKLSKQRHGVWVEFFQRGINIVEGARGKNPDERMKLWRSNINVFSANLRRIQQLDEY